MDDDLLLRNPCNRVKVPKAKCANPHYLDTEDVARLVRALSTAQAEALRLEQTKRTTKVRKAHKYEQGKASGTLMRSRTMAVTLALATGCRKGEVLGLTWGNVDLDTGTIRIVQQLTTDGVRMPKTEQGKRTITIDADTVARLKAWKLKQAEFLLSLGIGQKKVTSVVTNEIGSQHDPKGFSQWWRRFCSANGFEGLRFHDLRHSHVNLLIGNNVDIKTVQGRLGHTEASTTLDIYASIIPANDEKAATIVGAILAAPMPVMGEVINL